MLLSMTGFSTDTIEIRQTNYTIEIKTLNSKGIEFNYKSPSLFRNLELSIKSIVQKKLERGKIDLMIYSKDAKRTYQNIDEDLFSQQYSFYKNLAEKVGSNTDVFSLVVQNYSTLQEIEDLSEDETNLILKMIENLCDIVTQYRRTEGQVIEYDISEWVNLIEERKNNIAVIEPQRIESRREKLLTGIQDIALNNEIDYNRLAQEVIYYIEKLDISEELSRLSQHIELFRQTIRLDQNNGKKLGFISQEMGREINTIGSKSNDSELQHLVVDMKDQLERIKEQLNNVA